jgi:predicted PurR-regulated permease PerM
MAFMLLESTGFPGKLRHSLPPDSLLLRNMSDFGKDIREYVFITTWTGLLAAALDVGLLLMLGVDFAVMWGIFSFFLSFVPNVGFILALIPPTVLALLEHGWPTALLVIIGYILINGAVDSVLKPRVMGQGLNISPLVVTLSLIFWAWVLGAIGAILAVPLTMMVKKLVFESNESTRWVATMLGSGMPESAASGESGAEGSGPDVASGDGSAEGSARVSEDGGAVGPGPSAASEDGGAEERDADSA